MKFGCRVPEETTEYEVYEADTPVEAAEEHMYRQYQTEWGVEQRDILVRAEDDAARALTCWTMTAGGQLLCNVRVRVRTHWVGRLMPRSA